jgi:hypothetical protein
VRRDPRNRGGAITIHFFSEEELGDMLRRVAGEDLW